LAEFRQIAGGQKPFRKVTNTRWNRVFLDECREPPDLAIEIISPGQSVTRLVQVCLWYVEHGVQIALLIDPRECAIIALRPGGQIQAYRRVGQIDLALLWRDPVWYS
jgi:Uma2 family endonuclease